MTLQSNHPGIDWQAGSWQAADPAPSAAEIVIAGDWAPIRRFAPLMDQTPTAVYGDLLPELRAGDLRIVNLECPLSTAGAPLVKSGTVLRGDPGQVRGLTTVPFEVAALANNHSFDYGSQAFRQTRELLHEHRIRTVGAGMNAAEAAEPLIVSVNRLKIGIINFSEGEDLTAAEGERPGVMGWAIERLAAIIQKLRAKVQGVVVICHGGLEYLPFPPPYVAAALQRLADAGADLIIGHHPHVPQGIEIHGGVPICYSLGNFVFYQPTDLLFRKLGYLVRAGFNSRGLARLQVLPYEIASQGLRLLKDHPRAWAFKQLQEISAPLARPEGIRQAWNGFLAYNGVEGFRGEVAKIMDQLTRDPAKGAAMFRNRLTTLQHRHHWLDTLTRLMEHKLDEAPPWARSWAEEYFTRKQWPV
ncbi:MAG: CapA family protein [Desulfobacterales bacterium]